MGRLGRDPQEHAMPRAWDIQLPVTAGLLNIYDPNTWIIREVKMGEARHLFSPSPSSDAVFHVGS